MFSDPDACGNPADDDLAHQGEQEVQNVVNPTFVEIPRKAKLFRVLMERELGIDWEHSYEDSEFFRSLQTNQLQDGYADCQQTVQTSIYTVFKT